MKKILFLLFLSVSSFAQVTIPDDVARYYLEQDERVKIMDSLLMIRNSRIENLEQRLNVCRLTNQTYQNDNKTFFGIISVKDEQIALRDQELKLAKKEIKRQYKQKTTIVGAGSGAVVGSFIGQPLVGAVVGGGIGFVVGLFKKTK